MENRRAVIISAICFGISIFLISAYVNQRESDLTKDFGEMVDVVVINLDSDKVVEEFTVLRGNMLRVDRVFKKFKQPTAVSKIQDVIGKSTFVTMYGGEQVVLTKLVTQDGKPVLDRQVAKSTRAVTIQISPHTGVGRLIRPGDHIDVLIAPHYDMKGTTVYESTTVFQNVMVLATGKNFSNAVPTRVTPDVLEFIGDEAAREKRRDIGNQSVERLPTSRPTDDYSTLTLQFTPSDAKKILYLINTYGDNRLYLTLRNSADQQVAQIKTTLLDDVLGPESDYGRSKRPRRPTPPPVPKFYDSIGGQAKPIY